MSCVMRRVGERVRASGRPTAIAAEVGGSEGRAAVMIRPRAAPVCRKRKENVFSDDGSFLDDLFLRHGVSLFRESKLPFLQEKFKFLGVFI